MNELALFAGAGGGILGTHLLGWRPVAAVEIEDYPRRVLLQRQADGILPRFPIWDDVSTFDGTPWRGKVDVVTGGFPCQDISAAGKGAGIEGERSGLWGEMARIINEVRPRYVFAENSPLLVSRGLTTVLRDLAQMGYDARWGVVGAHHIAAPHKRDRIWILATDSRLKRARPMQGVQSKCTQPIGSHLTDTRSLRPTRKNFSDSSVRRYITSEKKIPTGRNCTVYKNWWATEPDLGRVANGVVHRVDRLKAIGNGQVPAVVRLAWNILSEGIE